MPITPIASQAGMGSQAGSIMERAAAFSSDAANGAGAMPKQATISFEPSAASGSSSPIGQVGSGVMDLLRNFEETRSSSRVAMDGAQGGPASPIAMAKDELLAGPASVRPAAGGEISAIPAEGINHEDAIAGMMRSFDYAIETQLIVKTGSQFSTSASSLMRGQ